MEAVTAKRVVSLGSLCLTSKLLQSMDMKTESYPFDWIFSNPKMIAHCLNDDFATFLDRSYYVSKSAPNVRQCYHTFYSPDFRRNATFNHRDPTIDTDYDYLVRCVDRFRAVLVSPEQSLFLLIIGDDAAGDTSNFDLVSGALKRLIRVPSLLYLSHKSGGDRSVTILKQAGACILVEMVAGSTLHNGTRFHQAADND